MMNSDAPLSEPTTAVLGKQDQKLNYDIQSWSSYSASYHPKNILENKPSDQSSRWSSGTNDQLQYVTIKLDRMSVVSALTFGKYHKVHVCNLKEFKVYGGLSPNNMMELLHSGLRNDSEMETFSLKHKAHGVVFPCLYIKIAPLLAWGANFNFSIWYVEMHGTNEPEVVQRVYRDYVQFRETEVIRLCLKHFRQRNFQETFESLQKKTSLKLEDDLLTEIHNQLVILGDFQAAEALILEAADRGLFNEYISSCIYKPSWKRITAGNPEKPSMRGGHQMCIDLENAVIYLFGGWDGEKELSDFWSYHITDNVWKLLSSDTRKQGGPGPRSCHKICFDDHKKLIYLLGRYVDSDSRSNISLDSDFWKYDTSKEKWSLISSNTAAQDGPELIYDHQMVMDSTGVILYVFGGRIVGTDSTQTPYSGLYSYDTTNGRWSLLRSDWPQADGPAELKSRIGHSMLYYEKTGDIYIFAGQRNKLFLADFYSYNTESNRLRQISRDYSKQGGPDAGFTQRATIDPDLDEFYVFSGLIKEKSNTQESLKNSLWVYNIKKESWSKIDRADSAWKDSSASDEPCPRFAHQMVYNTQTKIQYLFGGNPGDDSQPNKRLDDFWQLELIRPKKEDVLRRALFLVRRQVFRELCMTGDSMLALKYLQSQVSAVVNHSDDAESKDFRYLTSWLFKWSRPMNEPVSNLALLSNDKDAYASRSELYESLLDFFPESMREPKGNIVDLVPML